MNRAVLIGRITRDPEIKETQSGKKVCNFTIAINRGFGKDEADFIDCVAWEKTAENLARYQQKGSQIAVEGRIQVRNYEDREGNKRKAVEVVAGMVEFLGGGKKKQEVVEGFTEVEENSLPF